MFNYPLGSGKKSILTCPQGHQWEPSLTGPGPTSGTDLACPVCGFMVDGAGSITETIAHQEKAAADLETVLPGEALPRSSRAATSQTVAGYEILGELGRGGMGVVYKARQTKLNRVVALKMILAGGYAGEAELRRFRTEAEAIARLQHPNIVQIHEVGEHDGLPFFALEFCAGGSLEKKLAGTPLPPKEAAALVETLARAMHAVHQQGIIHRDLKPANILLRGAERGARDEASSLSPLAPRPSPLIPKITDFGLAKKLEDVGQTSTGAIMGTPSYMAPEQAGGGPRSSPPSQGGERGGVGPPADLYALGAILYECLTGRPPFRAATALDTLMQVIADEPVPPRQLNPKTPTDLATICLKCLHKEPAKRYATGADLAEDLRRFRAGEPIKARPVGWVERTVKWVRRRPAIAALLGALAAVVVIAFALVTWQLRETKAALEQAEQQTRERALAQVNALHDAAPGAVPNILADLERSRVDVVPRLRDLWAEGGDQAKRMRLALALLPVEPEMVRAELVAWMLKVEEPAEVLLAREALLPCKAELTAPLWAKAEDAKFPEAERFRALAALAAFDPDSPRWSKSGAAAAEWMLRANPFYLASWTQALRPVRGSLLGSLGEVFRGQKLAEYQKEATTVLADYAADQPHVLADLLMDADEKQFAVIFPKLKDRGERSLPEMIREIDRTLPHDAKDEAKEKLAKRQANAAVALLKMDRPAKVWPLLKHSPDPRARSYLIHRLSPLGADAGAIVNRLDEEPDVTIRRALILSLGEYGEKELSADARKALLAKLQGIYRAEADPGLHAASEWLLRT